MDLLTVAKARPTPLRAISDPPDSQIIIITCNLQRYATKALPEVNWNIYYYIDLIIQHVDLSILEIASLVNDFLRVTTFCLLFNYEFTTKVMICIFCYNRFNTIQIILWISRDKHITSWCMQSIFLHLFFYCHCETIFVINNYGLRYSWIILSSDIISCSSYLLKHSRN